MGGGAGQAAGPVSSLEKIFWAVTMVHSGYRSLPVLIIYTLLIFFGFAFCTWVRRFTFVRVFLKTIRRSYRS